MLSIFMEFRMWCSCIPVSPQNTVGLGYCVHFCTTVATGLMLESMTWWGSTSALGPAVSSRMFDHNCAVVATYGIREMTGLAGDAEDINGVLGRSNYVSDLCTSWDLHAAILLGHQD